MVANLRDIFISPDSSISQAMFQLDQTGKQILLVVDANSKFLGTITDGDIRRAILSNFSTQKTISTIFNRNPFVFKKGVKYDIQEAQKKQIAKIPVLDDRDHVVKLYELYGENTSISQNNPVVLMAGGMGTRLRPLTEDRPKPLLHVGEKPILETIIENFQRKGFKDIYLSVNYKAEMIKDYFQDGSSLGVSIKYLEEKERLGTAGALSLLKKEEITSSFFVMNADLLTNVDFQKMLDYHNEQKAIATIGVREYDFQVPYGVVNSENGYVQSIQEKPIHSFFVSAGIYLLDPLLLDQVPSHTFYDMPTLIENAIKRKELVSSFPIHEYWLDIGRQDEYLKANREYKSVFDV